MKYNYKILKQKQYIKGDKFETLETTDLGDNFTSENVEIATSPETMRFFRNMGSKQQIKRECKNGLEIIKIYSYSLDKTLRNVHIFTEI